MLNNIILFNSPDAGLGTSFQTVQRRIITDIKLLKQWHDAKKNNLAKEIN